MNSKQIERELAALNEELETPEAKEKIASLSVPEQQNIIRIAKALEGIEAQLKKLNSGIRIKK